MLLITGSASEPNLPSDSMAEISMPGKTVRLFLAIALFNIRDFPSFNNSSDSKDIDDIITGREDKNSMTKAENASDRNPSSKQAVRILLISRGLKSTSAAVLVRCRDAEAKKVDEG